MPECRDKPATGQSASWYPGKGGETVTFPFSMPLETTSSQTMGIHFLLPLASAIFGLPGPTAFRTAK